MEAGALLRLLQLSSPALPVGAYAYSHGLEQAVTAGWVHDELSAQAWILGVTGHCVAPLVVPVLGRLVKARQRGDAGALERWEALCLAMRESGEIALEDGQTGRSLARLLVGLGVDAAEPYRRAPDVSYTAMFALACVHFQIPVREAQHALLFSFCENQAVVAMKVVPLGQTAGQRMLSAALDRIPGWVAHADQLSDDEVGPTGPGLALASARHETQYSRLFRS